MQLIRSNEFLEKESSKRNRFLRTCEPHANENVLSFLIRLAEINRYSTIWITKEVRSLDNALYPTPRSILFGRLDLSKLALLSGNSVTTLQNLIYPYYPGNLKNYYYDSPIPTYMLAEQPRICPKCLAEEPYARKIWDLQLFTVCPHHHTFLISRCPNCEKPLSWTRICIYRCSSCHYDLRQARGYQAKESDIKVSKLLNEVVEGLHSPNIPYLNLMTLPDLCSLLVFIGGQCSGVTDVTGKTLSFFPGSLRHSTLKIALKVLEHWPDNFYSFLDNHYKTPRQKGYLQTGLNKDFGSFYRMLYTSFETEPFAFLRKEFEEYVKVHWQGGYVNKKCRLFSKEIEEKSKYISLTHTLKVLRLDSHRVGALIRIGYLKAISRSMGKKTMYRIEEKSVQALKSSYDATLTVAETAKLLRIDRHQVVRLISQRALKAFLGPIIDGSSIWRVEKKSIDATLAALRQRVKEEGESPVNLINFHEAVRKFSLIKIGTDSFLNLVLDNVIVPRKEIQGFGLDSFLFESDEVLGYLRKRLNDMKGKFLSMVEAAERLGVKQEVLLFWTKKGLLPNAAPPDKSRFWWKIDPNELEIFKEKYVLGAKVAGEMKTSPKSFAQRCIDLDVTPVSGPGYDGGRQYLFRRSELEAVIGLISWGWPK